MQFILIRPSGGPTSPVPPQAAPVPTPAPIPTAPAAAAIIPRAPPAAAATTTEVGIETATLVAFDDIASDARG